MRARSKSCLCYLIECHTRGIIYNETDMEKKLYITVHVYYMIKSCQSSLMMDVELLYEADWLFCFIGASSHSYCWYILTSLLLFFI